MNAREELLLAMDGDGSSSRSMAPLRLCEWGLGRLRVQGVGVALISSPESRTLLSASGELAGRVEDLQFSLGEGPCLDAFSAGMPSLEPDLSDGGLKRWPVFASAALDAGVRAVFAFPLQVGPACFGVLDVARNSPGMLDDEQIGDAMTMAEVAAETVLSMQAEAPTYEVSDDLGGVTSGRLVVHQATGMVAAQAGVNVGAAMARLRAHAYAEDRGLVDVAADVVARVLRFSP